MQNFVGHCEGLGFIVSKLGFAQVSNRTLTFFLMDHSGCCVLGLGQGWERMNQLGGCGNQPGKTKGFGARV